MNLALAFVLVGLSVAQIIALAAILYRHAIPRSPKVFHALLVGPMIVSASTAMLMGFMALANTEMLFGFSLDSYELAFFSCEFLTFSILCVYSLFYWLHGRYGDR